MTNLNLKKLFFAIVMMMAVMPMFAADGTSWSAGRIQTVLSGGEVDNAAGMVFVSPVALTSAEDIAAVPGEYQAEPVSLTGNLYGSDTNKEWFFYVKPNSGYKFIGFVSTATNNPSGSNLAEKLDMLGDYYKVSAPTGSPYKEYPQEAPKVLTRYAVFEKIGGGSEGGDQGGDPGNTDTATEAKVLSVTNQYGKNLIDATLTANIGENFADGDMVTHIYVTFDHDLKRIPEASAAAATLAASVSLVNTTTGHTLAFNKYSCGVKDNNILDLFISSEDFINNQDHQGVYVATIPAGVATTTNGLPTEACSFSFTYGDPDAVHVTTVDLDSYVGDYVTEDKDASFSFVKENDEYYMTNLTGCPELKIALLKNGSDYSFAKTESDNYTFSGYGSDNVGVSFSDNGKKKSILVEQYVITNTSNAEQIIGGECYFVKATSTAINNVNASNDNTIYNILGQKVNALAKGLIIKNGKKTIVK